MLLRKGWNISNISILIDVGVLGGLDKNELEEYMNSERGKQEVLAEDRKAKTEQHVSGVPYFIVHGIKIKPFSGAQDTEFWLEIFNAFIK